MDGDYFLRAFVSALYLELFSPGILRLLVFFNRAIRMIGIKILENRPLCKRGT